MPSSPILTPPGARLPEEPSLRPLLARLLSGLGLALLAATIFQLGLLWIGQYRDNPEWRFAALTTTIDHYALLLLGLAAFVAALHLQDRTTPASVRGVAITSLILGVLALVCAVLLVIGFPLMRLKTDPPVRQAFTIGSARNLALALIYVVALIRTGARGFRR